MYKYLIFLLFSLIILLKIKKENFRCNIPYRTSNKCFVDKYQGCMNDINDKFYCQDVANIECTIPPTVSSKFYGEIRCL